MHDEICWSACSPGCHESCSDACKFRVNLGKWHRLLVVLCSLDDKSVEDLCCVIFLGFTMCIPVKT
jgi:hypothetical protein